MVTVNKYGKTIFLPGKEDTGLEKIAESVLKEAGADYVKQFAFDETGLRAKKFDFAVLKNGRIVFLIECDGAPHYKEEYYVSCGNRECRAKAHLVKRHLGDAEKDAIAVRHGLPLLRINEMHKEIMRDLILAWVWQFCDHVDEKAKEISMVKMLDKYGWDFEYVRPSDTTKAEELFLNERG
jgi:hypothetical protein